MIIKSNFRDYYDVGQRYGQDFTRQYLRYEKEIVLDDVPSFICTESRGQGYLSYSEEYVGFCGKIYMCLVLRRGPNSRKTHLTTSQERESTWCCYQISDVDKWIEAYGDKKCKEHYYTEPDPLRRVFANEDSRHYLFSRFLKFTTAGLDKKLGSLFEEHNCPIFTFEVTGNRAHRKAVLILNPKLQDLHFFRVFDAYRTYQEIEMFLGNAAEPRKLIPAISNDDMIESKGFNLKASFRKEKKTKVVK